MTNPIKIKEDCFYYGPCASSHDYGDVVDGMWGGGGVEITKGQLVDLLQGKVIYFQVGGEYHVLLRVEKDG